MAQPCNQPLTYVKVQVTSTPVSTLTRPTQFGHSTQGTGGFQRLSKSALVITLTELMAIAAPATTGFR